MPKRRGGTELTPPSRKIAQIMTSAVPSSFRFGKFETTADALMRVKTQAIDMPEGEFVA